MMIEKTLARIGRAISRVEKLPPPEQAHALKTVLFGNGLQWQGLRQVFNTIKQDPAKINPSMAGQINKQVEILDSLILPREAVAMEKAYTVFLKVVMREIKRIIKGEYETAFSTEHDYPERLYILSGLVFGTLEYQGLKQGLTTIIKGGDERQVWAQIKAIEAYMS